MAAGLVRLPNPHASRYAGADRGGRLPDLALRVGSVPPENRGVDHDHPREPRQLEQGGRLEGAGRTPSSSRVC
jgi:hypothetical protein